jgi:hypothetical protein
MSLAPGARLGPYEILLPLGAGGMGEVHRAKDTRLDREVAIKVLPEAFAQDPERLARFGREATLFGLERYDGQTILVMELVEGEGLDEVVARGPVPVDEAAPLALQIAEALEAAHEHGIIHRDLKPANVKIRPDGTAKVLDFGLAKAWEEKTGATDLTHSPTITSHHTQAGVILGSAAYMSPEQARGKPVDKRADIWAFGVVLFEMLTGRRMFEGETVSDVLAGVLRGEIDWSSLPVSTPPAMERLLHRCLERNPKDRLRDIGDAALELRENLLSPSAEERAGGVPVRSGRRLLSRFAVLSSTVALAAVLVAAWALTRGTTRSGGTHSPATFELKTFEPQVIYNARFLPNGRGIVYSAALTGNVPELFMLSPGEDAPKKLAGKGTQLLSVSAEGELAVLTDAQYINHRNLVGTLARMSLDGSPRPLVEGVRDADWGTGGTLAIVRRVGGTDRLEYPIGTVLYKTSGYVSDIRVSPDGGLVAFLDHQWWLDDRGWLKVVDRSGRVRTLSGEFWSTEGVSWSADGRKLLFSGARGSNDLQPRMATLSGSTSSRVLSVPGSFTVLDVAKNGDWLAIDDNERFDVGVHFPDQRPDLELTWLDSCWNPVLSPDGKALLFTNGRGGPNYSVVTRRLDGSPITTLGEGDAKGFSPDGRWAAALIANPPSAVVYPIGAGAPRTLERGPIESYQTLQWFPDSSELLVSANEPSRPIRDFRQSIGGDPPEPVTPEGISGSLRPDGKAILALDGHGVWQLYPVGKGSPTVARGLSPDDRVDAWSRDGSAVYVEPMTSVPLRLDRVDLRSGERSPALTIAPEQRVGLVRITLTCPVLDPAQPYAYAWLYELSNLYIVHAVKP